MVAGLNLIARIWNYSYNLGEGDDSIGGAQPSGTASYQDVTMRIQSLKPTYPLLEQGVETIEIFTGLIHPHTIDVKNNNEIEITAPANSPWYGERFRVKGSPRRTSTGASDSRGYLLVNLQRIESSRSQQ